MIGAGLFLAGCISGVALCRVSWSAAATEHYLAGKRDAWSALADASPDIREAAMQFYRKGSEDEGYSRHPDKHAQ